MATKGMVSVKRPIRQLSVREKLDAIQRVHNGESKASVARDIGVPESTLRGWCKSEDKLRNVARSCGTPESQHSVEEPDNKDISRSVGGESGVGGGGGAGGGGGDVSDGGPSDRKRASLEVEVNHTKTPQPQPELDEALWFWLKQHQQVGLSMTAGQLLDNKGATDLNKNGVADGSWFWRWYKGHEFSQYPDPLQQVDKTKVNSETLTPGLQKANGHSIPIANSANNNNARSTLDSVLLNLKDNNNVVNSPGKTEESDDDDEEDEPPATAAEAVNHGEKFLRWLECCSDPSVTTMQILQFRYLLNNVRACANRRAKQTKTKTRSRRK